MAGIPVPAVEHSEPIPGDTLTRVAFNYKWRAIIAELLNPMCYDEFWSGTAEEVEDAVANAMALIEDLYTGQAMHPFSAKVINEAGQAVSATTTQMVFEDPSLSSYAWDSDGFWSPVSPHLLTVPVGGDGIYLCTAHVYLTYAANWRKYYALTTSTSVNIDTYDEEGDSYRAINLSGFVPLSAGDHVQLSGFSNPPCATFGYAGGSGCNMQLLRVGDLP